MPFADVNVMEPGSDGAKAVEATEPA